MTEKQGKILDKLLSASEKLPEERQYTLLGVAIGTGPEPVQQEMHEGKSA